MILNIVLNWSSKSGENIEIGEGNEGKRRIISWKGTELNNPRQFDLRHDGLRSDKMVCLFVPYRFKTRDRFVLNNANRADFIE